MSQVSNPFQACNDIFFQPSAVFAAIAEKHNWSWIPFILVAVMALLPGYFYFDFVDFEWYKQLIIESQSGELSPNEKKVMADNMSPGQFQTFTFIAGGLGLIVINAIVAVYLNVMTKSDEQNMHGFTDWYGFTWWAGLPTIFAGLIALAIMLWSSDHQLSPAALAPTSAAYWFNVPVDSDWFNWAQSVRLETLWSIYLTAIGIQQWTRIPEKKAIAIAVAPTVVILGGWALIKLF